MSPRISLTFLGWAGGIDHAHVAARTPTPPIAHNASHRHRTSLGVSHFSCPILQAIYEVSLHSPWGSSEGEHPPLTEVSGDVPLKPEKHSYG